MKIRAAALLLGMFAALPAQANEMRASEARKFVAGHLFAFNCFDGTSGAGRINADGSVAGSVRAPGNPAPRFMALPTGTLRVNGERICASLRSLPFEPCFHLQRTGSSSFRGSVSGLGFAYCDFTRRSGRMEMVRATTRPKVLPSAASAAAASAPVAPVASAPLADAIAE
jgi:hypothetical protein